MPKPTLSDVNFPRLSKRSGAISGGTITSPDATSGFLVVINGQANKRWVGTVGNRVRGNVWNVDVTLLRGLRIKNTFGIEGIAVTITNPTTLETSDPPVISTTTIP